VSATDREIMRARLAKLRAVLRDEMLMAHVRANVEQWPPLTDEQRDTLAALLHRHAKRPARRAP